MVAPFDVKALDMFKLIAMQSNKPMHFFPMAMYSHQLVPPPKGVSRSAIVCDDLFCLLCELF